MGVKRTFLFFIGAAVIGVSMFVLLTLSRPTPAELLKAEREVYSAVLQDMRNAYSIEINKFQVAEYTSPEELKGYFPEDSAGYSVDFTEIPDLKKETWKDYQEKNKVSHPIENYLPFTLDVILVDPSGVGIDNGTNDKRFYWWISFSRIGFNSSLTQALVLIGDCRGESCFGNSNVSMYSQGYYVFLEKEKEEWTIRNQQRNWLIEVPAP